MALKRVVVCLDVKNGRVVKGVQFKQLRDVGDPVELAARYEAEGADEIVFLDVSATLEERGALLDTVSRTAEQLFIPLTVGGGVRSVEDVARLLRAGADKVSINSAAVRDPALLTACAERFGAQCIVASIDAERTGDGTYRVHTRGGTNSTQLSAVTWAQECARLGAGEILLTSIDRDGARSGYDLELTRSVVSAVSVPVIASGGAGSAAHVAEALEAGADAALVAGILHDGTTTVGDLKAHVASRGIAIRRTALPLQEKKALLDLDSLDFAKGGGLVTVVAQDASSSSVLMVAHADREALELTIRTGLMHYRSRSRGLWKKGETSGNTQQVISLATDCDRDTVLARVLAAGPACHLLTQTCFPTDALDPLSRLAQTLEERHQTPSGYTGKLLGDRNLRLKKLGEEAAELVTALADGDRVRATEECADLLFHMLVAARAAGVELADIVETLDRRARPSPS